MVARLIEKSQYIGDGLWRWSVALPSKASLRDVETVVYTLDPTFSRPVRRVQSRETGFLVEDITSRPFTVYAKVTFTDGGEQLLEKDLELTPRPSGSDPVISRPPRPVLVAVEDDSEVLHAIERDLRQRYAAAYGIQRFDSGVVALEYLRGAKSERIEVTVIISDLRMPVLNGVDFLIKAACLNPRAKRMLLTAYADTDAAIRAVNEGINAYILKPWDPPERELYPVVDDLARQWWSTRSDVSVSKSLRTRVPR